MFNTGQIYVSENVLKIAEENEIMALLERHKKLDDDTNGEDRAVNEYAINQGFGNIINIYNIKNERVKLLCSFLWQYSILEIACCRLCMQCLYIAYAEDECCYQRSLLEQRTLQ